MPNNDYHPHDPSQDQDQDQDQDQAQAQANLQAQLQGPGQGQGQGQAQYSAQAVDTSVWNNSANENGNLNFNGNGNLNANGNLNYNENVNHIQNTVDTTVNVKVDLDLSSVLLPPTDNSVIDIDSIHDIHDSIVMPSVVTQTTEDGNNFNIAQVNNLTDNDTLSSPSVNFNSGGLDYNPCHVPEAVGDFSMTATATGGSATSSIGDIHGGSDGYSGIGAAAANVALTQEAFTQHIAMGANIQFNSVDHLTVSGHDIGTL